MGKDFKPDVMIMAKGLANGFPISGIVASKELMNKVTPGSFGGTYAGNAVACAAGIAAQEVFQTQDIAGNVAARSEQLFGALNELAQADETKHLIAEVRGEGVSAVSLDIRSPIVQYVLRVGTRPSSRFQIYNASRLLAVLQKYTLKNSSWPPSNSALPTR